ncbi:MAG: nucleoid-associated protein [Candidatus Delongbacteria bacterium]|nr:nucleoid-associated protein [Candidatus Delongbacteria bacterium]
MAQKIDTSTILIERIIVHDIPKHKKGETGFEPVYSEQESKLTDGLRNFFKDKVVQSLSSDKAFKICFDEENASPISWITNEFLNSDGSKIVSQSKAITKHLFEIQVGYNAAGILVLIFGKVNYFNTCIILKLEKDKGAQLTLDLKTHSYNIAEVEDLMLTQKTKIFKVAMFILRDNFKVKFDGLIMDYQIDIKEKKEATTWFIEKFLGCRAFEDPKITTQHFYNYTRTFIDTIPDDINKAKYVQDLNSYVQKNTLTLNPKEFADDYLTTTEHKNDYRNYLLTKKFNFSAFPRDITQIEKHVKKITLAFENDISIIGNKGTFDKKVKLEKLDNGQTRAEVVSKIKKII